MIRFLYRSGSDETREQIERGICADLEAGRDVVLLVPEQETVSVERRMLELLPAAAQLRFEVLNFTRLANRTFRALGGLSHRNATPAVSALLMWRTLRELTPMLSCYASASSDTRLCHHFLATNAQCKAYCVEAEDLLSTADGLAEDEPLRKKLTDLGLVLSTFAEHASAHGALSEDELSRAAQKLLTRGKELFANTAFWVDSFTDFTAQQLNILRAILRHAHSVTMALVLDSHKDAGIHLASATAAQNRLVRLAKEENRRVFLQEEPAQKPQTAPAFLARHLWDMTAEPAPLSLARSDALRVCVAASPFAEAEAAAAEIHRLVRTGCRYRDVAVVVRDASAWVGILDAALEKEGIPCYLSEKTDISVRPLIKLILQALRIYAHGWREEDVLGYLKSGLCGVCADDVNGLETYMAARHPRGARAYCAPFSQNPDGYSTVRSARGTRILESANRAREALVPPLAAWFEALDGAQNADEMCHSLANFLQQLNVAEQLRAQAAARLAEGERREAEELARLYGTVLDALAAICDTMGDQVLSVAEFTDALTLVFSATDIGTIPTAADEVTIGSASMLRTDRVRHVLVLGLNAGEFPRTVRDDGLLSASERETLSKMGIELSCDRATAASDELFYVRRAFAAPRETLWLSWSKTATDGRANEPSLAIERVHALFPDKKDCVPDARDPIASIYTPAALVERLPAFDAQTKDALQEVLAEQGLFALTRRLQTPVVHAKASIPREEASALFETRALSPTQLESFASCAFYYYCSKILHLREEAEDTPRFSDRGTFLHYVFEHVMRALRDGITDADGARIQALVRESCADYRRALTDAGNEPNATTKALFTRLETLATLVVTGLLRELSDSSFTPAFLEFDLKRLGSERSVLSTKGGDRIPLAGKIDRVDIWKREDGTAFVRVADYKTGSKKFDPEQIKNGYCMQMPLYLSALCGRSQSALARELGLPADTEFRPAGVTYLSTAVKTETTAGRKSEDLALSAATERLVREGVLLDDAEVLAAMSHTNNPDVVGGGRSKANTRLSSEGFRHLFDELSDSIARITKRMKQGEAHAAPVANSGRSPCDYCPYGTVCRAAQKSR